MVASMEPNAVQAKNKRLEASSDFLTQPNTISILFFASVNVTKLLCNLHARKPSRPYLFIVYRLTYPVRNFEPRFILPN